MKTNSLARCVVKIRVVIVCAVLAAIVGLECFLGESLAARIGHTTARQTDSPAASNASIADAMALAR